VLAGGKVAEQGNPAELLAQKGLYGDIVVDVTTKGVSPEWIYEQLMNVYQ